MNRSVWVLCCLFLLPGCNNTLEEVRRKPLETGQFHVQTDYQTVIQNIRAAAPSCLPISAPAMRVTLDVIERNPGQTTPGSLTEIVANLNGITGSKVYFAIDVIAAETGAMSSITNLLAIMPSAPGGRQWRVGQPVHAIAVASFRIARQFHSSFAPRCNK